MKYSRSSSKDILSAERREEISKLKWIVSPQLGHGLCFQFLWTGLCRVALFLSSRDIDHIALIIFSPYRTILKIAFDGEIMPFLQDIKSYFANFV